MAEFNVAGVHRDVICEAYPARRVELDTYLAIISDQAYHMEVHCLWVSQILLSKAALYISKINKWITKYNNNNNKNGREEHCQGDSKEQIMADTACNWTVKCVQIC